MEKYKIIGAMSGTSLDGLDLAYCEFRFSENKWNYEIFCADTIIYDGKWKDKLRNADKLSGEQLTQLNIEYGIFTGDCINGFVQTHSVYPEYIASHGHTVFHQPEKKITLQIGGGASIAATTGLSVINDFRALDVALGGQGAPLVPIGDRLLFSDYQICLNLGGFANLSYENNNKRIAFDICPVNILLNHFANLVGKEYDKDGAIARRGNLHERLFDELNSLPFYSQEPPKSLGKEWVWQNILPLMNKYDLSVEDSLHTLTEHSAYQIGRAINTLRNPSVLITGGGAFNNYLIENIKKYTSNTLVIPDPILISFKEALIFAFLGVLRLKGENNCLSSVTGASKDNCGGIVWLP